MKLLSALLLLAAAAPTVQDFRYQRPLAAAPAQAGQACFAIAPDVFSHAAPGLGDLRLYRTDAGSAPLETPYLTDVAQSVDGSALSIAVINTGTHDGAIVFDAAMPDGSGAVMIDGKMQDDATWKQAKVLVDLARLVAAKDPDMAARYAL